PTILRSTEHATKEGSNAWANRKGHVQKKSIFQLSTLCILRAFAAGHVLYPARGVAVSTLAETI
ncbi:MAG: hypothetical protein AAF745_06680, partial [Planctomycetota bacterium]